MFGITIESNFGSSMPTSNSGSSIGGGGKGRRGNNNSSLLSQTNSSMNNSSNNNNGGGIVTPRGKQKSISPLRQSSSLNVSTTNNNSSTNTCNINLVSEPTTRKSNHAPSISATLTTTNNKRETQAWTESNNGEKNSDQNVKKI